MCVWLKIKICVAESLDIHENKIWTMREMDRKKTLMLLSY